MVKDNIELSLDLENEVSENLHFWKENCYNLININYTPKDGYKLTKVTNSDQILWKSDDTSYCSKVTVCHNNNIPVLVHLNLVNKGLKEVLYFINNQQESLFNYEDNESIVDIDKWKKINFQQFYIKVNHYVQLNQILKNVELSIRSKVDSRKIFVNNSCELLVDVYVPNVGFRMTSVRDGLSDIWRATSPFESCTTVFIFPRTNYSNIHLVIEDTSEDVPTKTDLYFKRSYLSWQKISKDDYFMRFENEFGTTGLNREHCDLNVDLYCYYYKYIYLRMDDVDPDLFYIDKTYCDKVTNFAIIPKPGFFLKEVFVDTFLIKCSRNETVLYANLHFYQDCLLSFYLIVSCYGSERVLYFMKKDSVWSVVNFSQYISSFIHFSYYRTTISRAISISSTKSSSRSSSFNIVRKGSFGSKKKLVLRTVNIRKLLRKNGNLDDDVFHGKIFTSSFRNKDDLLIRTFFSPAENYTNPKKVKEYRDKNKEKDTEKEYMKKSNRNVILVCGIGSSFKELFLSTNINKLLKKINFVNLNSYTNFNRDGREKTPKGGIGIKYYRKYSEMFNDSNYVNDDLLDIFKVPSYSGSIVEMLNKLGYNVYAYDLQSNGLSEGVSQHKCHFKDYKDNVYDLLQFVSIVKNNKFFDNTQKYNSEEIFSNSLFLDFTPLSISNASSSASAASSSSSSPSPTLKSSLSPFNGKSPNRLSPVSSPHNDRTYKSQVPQYSSAMSSPSRYTKEKNEYVLLGFSMGANICLQAIKLYDYYNRGGDPLADKFISVCGMYNITDNLTSVFKNIIPKLNKVTAAIIPTIQSPGMKYRNFGTTIKRYKEFMDPYYYIFKFSHLMCNQIFEACKNSLKNLEDYPKTVKTLVIHSSHDNTCHVNGSNTLYENIESDENIYIQLNSNCHQIVTYEYVGLMKDIFQKIFSVNIY